VRAASGRAAFAALALAGSSPARDAGAGLPLRIEIGDTRAIKIALPMLNAPFISVGEVGDVNGDGRGDVGVRAVQGHAGEFPIWTGTAGASWLSRAGTRASPTSS
jgi:hypothetical protein